MDIVNAYPSVPRTNVVPNSSASSLVKQEIFHFRSPHINAITIRNAKKYGSGVTNAVTLFSNNAWQNAFNVCPRIVSASEL